MKKNVLFLLMATFCFGFMPLKAQRYLTEMFSSVDVTSNVTYSVNISVITGAPGADTLMMDVYEPSGDTMTERPVVFMAHTGSFLPVPLNGQATGNRHDSTVVEMCTQLAKRGFVAIAYNYRLGWNPVGTQEDRTGTLINAAYRGIQDSHTLARYLRMDAATMGNTYGIDTSRFITGGAGTGGYISLGVAFLDSYDEINLTKFIDPTSGNSYVDTALSGDINGTWTRPLNIANHLGYSSEFHMAFNMGGAVGDTTWIEAGEMPCVSVGVPNDPFAPFDFGAVIVPTTGDFVVNVSGSKGVQRRQNSLGNNAPFTSGIYTDAYTTAADAINEGYKGLFPFNRPTPESAPWEWWDTIVWNVPHPSGGTFNDVGMLTNPDMSAAKGTSYVDSTLGYLCPRIVCALSLPGCNMVAVAEEMEAGSVTVYPNPSSELLYVKSNVAGNLIQSVRLIDLQGRTVFVREGIKALNYNFDHDVVTSGMYFLKVETREGFLTQKVILD